MEPSHLNSSPTDEARLQQLLHAANPVLPDKGFSRRVLQALPAPSPKSTRFRRLIVGTIGGLAGAVFASRNGVTWPEWNSVPQQLATRLAQISDPSFAFVLIVTALSLLFAFRVQLRDRLFS